MARPRKFDEDKVVEAAMQLFWGKGYKATTPRELLAATGLSKSSLYNTFGSKEGLFVRAIECYIVQREADLAEHLEGDDLHASLIAYFQTTITEGTAGPGRSCLVCTTLLSTTEDDLLAYVSARQGHERLRAVLSERIRRGQLEGEVGRERTAEDLAQLVFSHTMGLNVLARGGAGAEGLMRASRVVADAVLA